jgi:hypothetical protein
MKSVMLMWTTLIDLHLCLADKHTRQHLLQFGGWSERPGEPLNATLLAALQHRELLLLLDNCEHVLDDVAALVDELLRGCSHLRALATSREALGVAGERIWRVPPLRTPGPSQTADAPEQVAQREAAALFLDRASAVQPDVPLTRRSIQALAEICRRLDGIPLGIELAAARTKHLTIEQIAERLDDRFRLLTTGSRSAPTRQQTLRAAIDWSCQLLSEQERLLFDRLRKTSALALSLAFLARVEQDEGDVGTARTLAEQALSVASEAGYTRAVCIALVTLGDVAYQAGEYGKARELLLQASARGAGDPFYASLAMASLGRLAVNQHDLRGGRDYLVQSLRLARGIGQGQPTAHALESAAALAVATQRPVDALLMAGAAAAMRKALPLRPFEREMLIPCLELARTSVGAEAADQIWADAQSMSLDGATVGALQFLERLLTTT